MPTQSGTACTTGAMDYRHGLIVATDVRAPGTTPNAIPIFARRLTLSFQHRAFSASCKAALIHARQLHACVKRQSIIELLGGMEDYLGLCVWHRHDHHAAK